MYLEGMYVIIFMNIALRNVEGYYGLLFKSVKELCLLIIDNERSLSLLRTRYANPLTPMPHDQHMFMITFALCFTQRKPKVKDYGFRVYDIPIII